MKRMAWSFQSSQPDLAPTSAVGSPGICQQSASNSPLPVSPQPRCTCPLQSAALIAFCRDESAVGATVAALAEGSGAALRVLTVGQLVNQHTSASRYLISHRTAIENQ